MIIHSKCNAAQIVKQGSLSSIDAVKLTPSISYDGPEKGRQPCWSGGGQLRWTHPQGSRSLR